MAKWLIFDGSMGAAGDMLTASLLSLFDDPEEIVQQLNNLGIPGVVFQLEKRKKQGIEGFMMHVLVHGQEEGHLHLDLDQRHPHNTHHERVLEYHDHDHLHNSFEPVHKHDHHDHHDHSYPHPHHHTGMKEIQKIIETLSVSKPVKDNIQAVFEKLAQAESKVHGAPIDQIHFHEVGQMDALADISAVCYLIDKLSPDKIFCTPIHVGSGLVHCAHGWLPIPAPATALLLKGIPIYAGEIEGELCTPTGAALLSYFVDEFGPLPLMIPEKIGTGFGQKEFEEYVNMLRSYLAKDFKAEKSESESLKEKEGKEAFEIVELSCNLDDMTGEQIGYATDCLFKAGALDVYTTAIGMKKSRPGIKLSILCQKKDKESLIEILFKHTSTLGIREQVFLRHELKRKIVSENHEGCFYRIKKARGYGIEKEKIEYEDLARLAGEQDLSLQEMGRILEKFEVSNLEK